MTPFFQTPDKQITIYCADCETAEHLLQPESVHSIVTDPPYGLEFMGKDWDKGVPRAERWAAFLNLLTPGGHLLAFAGTRTHHRMASAIEDGGFEIRDMIAWVYGSGFPKSMNVSKAIDNAAGVVGGKGEPKRGAERLIRQTVDGKREGGHGWGNESGRDPFTYVPATDSAKFWHGWGTALKPALEPITVARKPFDGTVAANVVRHDTGAINVDVCRVPCEPRPKMIRTETVVAAKSMAGESTGATASGELTTQGRWPANVIHDGTDEAVSNFPTIGDGPEGSAARFFYCAKASKSERGEGNNHPTVKPLALMRYLCRLVTPPHGIVFDPYMGSGTTALAAHAEGFRFVGIEKSPEYCAIAVRRIEETLKG